MQSIIMPVHEQLDEKKKDQLFNEVKETETKTIPIATGIKALVEITRSAPLNVVLDARNNARSADERTRKSDASLVKSLPVSFANRSSLS